MTDNNLEMILAKVSDMLDERFIKIDEQFAKIDERFDKMDERFDRVENDIAEIKKTVNKNYDASMEFFVNQQEFNTYLSEQFKQIQARQEIFENQTVKNTAMLKVLK